MDASAAMHPLSEAQSLEPDSPSESPEPRAKQTKVRKGTRSCWQCKRRKVRCSFVSAEDKTCLACRRRGAACVSQTLPDINHQADDGGPVSDRMVRVEALLDRLVKQADRSSINDGTAATGSSDAGYPNPYTPVSDTDPVLLTRIDTQGDVLLHVLSQTNNERIPQSAAPPRTDQESQSVAPIQPTSRDATKLRKLSQILIAEFPSNGDMEILSKAGQYALLFAYHLNTRPHGEIGHGSIEFSNALVRVPSPSTHPVLIARQMLILALFLQQSCPIGSSGFLEDPKVIARRLVDAAASAVTTNESFFGPMESLECIVLEGVFQGNSANLRRAWICFRRALLTAQMMGLHRARVPPLTSIDPSTNFNPHFMWYRIVYLDRFSSLQLGFPQGTSDRSIISDARLANDTPTGRFERHLAAIAGRILERNETDPYLEDYETTQGIDSELLKAAQSLPVMFWTPPKFSGLQNDSPEGFWETMRLMDQLLYYGLLNVLHLPHLLRSNAGHKYDYSKLTCVTSSREILTRFVVYRAFNPVAARCRAADLFGLMASLTLLLAHLDSHRYRERSNFLSHQRLGDRAMMDQVLDTFDMVYKMNDDVFADKTAGLLRRLLEVEAEASQGHSFHAENVGAADGSSEDQGSRLMHISIPYFGIVRISREGSIHKDVPRVRCPVTHREFSMNNLPDSSGHVHGINHALPVGDNQSSSAASRISHAGIDHYVCAPGQQTSNTPAEALHGALDTTQSTSQAPAAAKDHDMMEDPDLYPGLTAYVDEWAFQGIDAAFFDNLMRGSDLLSGDEPGGGDWGQIWQADLGGAA